MSGVSGVNWVSQMRQGGTAGMRDRLLGVVFVSLLAVPPVLGLVVERAALSSDVRVWLRVEASELRPRPGAPVTLHGMTVGRVRAVTPVGHGASVELGLDQPVPAAVTGRLLPRTLVGDVYVELLPTASPSPSTSLSPGGSANPSANASANPSGNPTRTRPPVRVRT